MITYSLWKILFGDNFWQLIDYLFVTIMTPFTLILDILVIPFEIVALIIWEVRKKK